MCRKLLEAIDDGARHVADVVLDVVDHNSAHRVDMRSNDLNIVRVCFAPAIGKLFERIADLQN